MSTNGEDLEARIAALEEKVGILGVAVSNLVLAVGTLNSWLLAGRDVSPAETEQMHSCGQVQEPADPCRGLPGVARFTA